MKNENKKLEAYFASSFLDVLYSGESYSPLDGVVVVLVSVELLELEFVEPEVVELVESVFVELAPVVFELVVPELLVLGLV